MSVHITTISEQNRTVIKVDGWLKRDEGYELLLLCDAAEGPVALDLRDLQSIDRESVRLLRSLLDRGVVLTAGSPYVRLLLESDADRREPTGDNPG